MAFEDFKIQIQQKDNVNELFESEEIVTMQKNMKMHFDKEGKQSEIEYNQLINKMDSFLGIQQAHYEK